MNYEIIGKLVEEESIKRKYCLNKKNQILKACRDKEIADIILGKNKKFIAIVGPCSLDSFEGAYKYAIELAKIQEKIKDKILVIMRGYSVKPRSLTTEFKGILHSPKVGKEEDILNGIELMRKIHIKIFEESFLPVADELVYPDLYKYIDDTISYLTIGARSTENQQHKLIAGAIEQPIGFKNPLSGNINNAIDSIISSRNVVHCIYNNHEIKTKGNPLSHLILRGYIDENNYHFRNSDKESLIKTIELISKRGIKNTPIIIDASHSNSGKSYKNQKEVVIDLLNSINNSKLIKNHIKGVMLESYMYSGNQKLSCNYLVGKSLTDSCIGIKETEQILLKIAEQL